MLSLRRNTSGQTSTQPSHSTHSPKSTSGTLATIRQPYYSIIRSQEPEARMEKHSLFFSLLDSSFFESDPSLFCTYCLLLST